MESQRRGEETPQDSKSKDYDGYRDLLVERTKQPDSPSYRR